MNVPRNAQPGKPRPFGEGILPPDDGEPFALSSEDNPPHRVAIFQRAWLNCHGVALPAHEAKARLDGFARMGLSFKEVNCG
jgi:hypothetical protein